MNKNVIHLEVNGHQVEAVFSQKSIDCIWKPMLLKLKEIQRIKNERVIAYLVAPPAVGKSTLALFLERLSKQMEDMPNVQSIGLDGFHYSQEYIKTHETVVKGETVLMKDVKGCPETFNIEKIKERINLMKRMDVKWPIYDRNLHDVVEDQIDVIEDIILIEGNWLLLKDDAWKELKDLCDYSIFIDAEEELLKERLIQRKVTGGLSLQEAENFYERSDSKNVKRTKEDSQQADLEVVLLGAGDFDFKERMCKTHE